MDSFRNQPNLPIDVLKKQVKAKWNVDAHEDNVGSCLILMVERPMPEVPCRFQRLYVSFAAMKTGFLQGCRPVIGVDACFSKGRYKGQLMTAVGRDANNSMYPLSIVGLVPSLEQVCPTAEHRTCVRHLYANFRSAGHKGLLLKDLLWTAASSYTQTDFHYAMEEMKKVSEPAYDYLAKNDPSTWCRGCFNTMAKSDLVHNNCVECFNSWILKYRQLTIMSMLEGIRNKLMRRYVRKRELIAAMEDGSLGPKIMAKLEKEEDGASHCWCTYAGEGIFKVECEGKRVAVSVEGRTCGCRKWDVTGIPCSHAISAILYHGGNPIDYLSD
ncbi:uncharacterized protein LOC132177958 [Corylus avellana]|uniref:uncharacterized protein LOC132177958 n=1 Tax=Corylus avellana TaxID=13451 RepID=UPI00286D3706|nr:uncharacterized protein LOC132177958 [Corylus avellana]